MNWPDLTSPDLARLGVFKVRPRPDLAQWARCHCIEHTMLLQARYTLRTRRPDTVTLVG